MPVKNFLGQFIESPDCFKRKQICITVAVSSAILIVLILIFSIKSYIEEDQKSDLDKQVQTNSTIEI